MECEAGNLASGGYGAVFKREAILMMALLFGVPAVAFLLATIAPRWIRGYDQARLAAERARTVATTTTTTAP